MIRSLTIFLSDLLVRHERLTHNKVGSQKRDRISRTSRASVGGADVAATPHAQPSSNTPQSPITAYDGKNRGPIGSSRPDIGLGNDYPLATLSMAAEQAALEMPFGTPNTHDMGTHVAFRPEEQTVSNIPDPTPNGNISGVDFETSLDQLASFLDYGSLSSYHFSSLVSAEQPLPLFSPESIVHQPDLTGSAEHPRSQYDPKFNQSDESGSFSHFGSRLPSLQPEDTGNEFQRFQPRARSLGDISLEERKDVLSRMSSFASVIAPNFQLPSRLCLSRYVAGYINGFHEHLPFLHIPTMSIPSCSVELILAMAAVGAQYCFEGEKGIELFHTSKAIAIEKIRQRDARLVASQRQAESMVSSSAQGLEEDSNIYSSFYQPSAQEPSGLPAEAGSPFHSLTSGEDLIQTVQALLLLMALATWAKHKEIIREALALQSILASLVRDEGLESRPLPVDMTWEEWVRTETVKRTKFIVYCFFNLHCIVYDIPSQLLNSEIKLTLPSTALEFRAPTWNKWMEARKRPAPETNFQDALARLFMRGGSDVVASNSSLGNYVLIHAIIQHIFFLRQVARGRFDGGREMSPEDTNALEFALRSWQIGWKRHPESSLDPQDPNGPVAFNSTALLRLAYIRLNIDLGPSRGLGTRDPILIARAFRERPPIKRTPKLVRAVLHSAHALSIPVKIGIRLVAQTQTFIWSIQHSLCSLECAFLLSKWLEALSVPHPEPSISDDERRIIALVKMMLDETEFAVQADLPPESPTMIQQMNAGVLRVWAHIFKGTQTWALVGIIGNSLNVYADMLHAQ